MIVLNKTNNPLVLRHDGVALNLPCGVLVTPTAAEERALRDGLKKNGVMKALADSGAVDFGGKGLDDDAPLAGVSVPEVPETLKKEPVRNGRSARVKELKRDGSMDV